MEKIKKYILPLIISLVFVGIYSYSFDTKPDINGDNAQYIRLANVLVSGLGYSDVGINGITPANNYPPGYPFILSILMRLGFTSIVQFKLINGLFLLSSVLMLYSVVRRITKSDTIPFIAAVLTLFSPRLINFSFMAMSEMSFLFFSVLALYSLYEYSEENNGKEFWKSKYFYIAVISSVISYYIRSIGVSTIVATLTFFAFRREWKQLIASVGGVILLYLPWTIRNAVLGLESRYLGTIMTVNPWRPELGSVSTVGEMANKMINNFDETVIKSFKVVLFPFSPTNFKVPSTTLMVLVGLIIFAITIYGAWKMGRMRYFLLAFLLANIGVFLLWHGGNQTRYVVPIVPYIFICFYLAIIDMYKLIFKDREKVVYKYLPFCLLLLAIPMTKDFKQLHINATNPYNPKIGTYFDILKSASNNLPKGTIICCRKPEFISLFAKDLLGINYLYSLDPEEVIKDLIKKRVEFVVLDRIGYASTVRYLKPAIDNNIELFTVVARTTEPETFLFAFDRDKAIEKYGIE